MSKCTQSIWFFECCGSIREHLEHCWDCRFTPNTEDKTLTPPYPTCLPPADYPLPRGESVAVGTCKEFAWEVSYTLATCPGCEYGVKGTREEIQARVDRKDVWWNLYQRHKVPRQVMASKARRARRQRMHKRREVRSEAREKEFFDGFEAHRADEGKRQVPDDERVYVKDEDWDKSGLQHKEILKVYPSEFWKPKDMILQGLKHHYDDEPWHACLLLDVKARSPMNVVLVLGLKARYFSLEYWCSLLRFHQDQTLAQIYAEIEVTSQNRSSRFQHISVNLPEYRTEILGQKMCVVDIRVEKG